MISDMNAEVKRIPLDRRVCIVREERIDLRPERGAVIGPLIGLAISVGVFVIIALFANDLSVTALAVMLIPGVILAPFSAMGLVYSVIGAAVIVEAKKQSVRFQQGVMGLGLGTIELVPFWKIERIEVEDFDLGEASSRLPRPGFDLRAWDIVLVKASGKRLSIGQVMSANNADLIEEGFNRALDAAEAIAGMAGKPVVITAAVEEEAAQPVGTVASALSAVVEAPRGVRNQPGVVMTTEAEVLRNYGTIAVVGLSSDPERPSLSVAAYLQDHGYRIIPVNPNESEVLGENAYPNLSSIDEPVEIVQIFRRPKHAPDLVEEAIRIGAKAIWMQEGISHDAAAARARAAGMAVVMDRCMRTEHRKLSET